MYTKNNASPVSLLNLWRLQKLKLLVMKRICVSANEVSLP